jgi:hypothetical protein
MSLFNVNQNILQRHIGVVLSCFIFLFIIVHLCLYWHWLFIGWLLTTTNRLWLYLNLNHTTQSYDLTVRFSSSHFYKIHFLFQMLLILIEMQKQKVVLLVSDFLAVINLILLFHSCRSNRRRDSIFHHCWKWAVSKSLSDKFNIIILGLAPYGVQTALTNNIPHANVIINNDNGHINPIIENGIVLNISFSTDVD